MVGVIVGAAPRTAGGLLVLRLGVMVMALVRVVMVLMTLSHRVSPSGWPQAASACAPSRPPPVSRGYGSGS